jgi:hypothetical protein
MKIAGYSQNTLPKQSFGMKIVFHPDDMRETYLPNYGVMDYAIKLTNVDPVVERLEPKTVYLKYKGQVSEFRFPNLQFLGKKIVDTWTLVSDGIKSERTIKIPRERATFGAVAERLVAEAKELAQKYQSIEKNSKLAKIIRAAGANVIM